MDGYIQKGRMEIFRRDTWIYSEGTLGETDGYIHSKISTITVPTINTRELILAPKHIFQLLDTFDHFVQKRVHTLAIILEVSKLKQPTFFHHSSAKPNH